MNRVLTGAVLLFLMFGVGCKSHEKASTNQSANQPANQDDAIYNAIQRHLGDAGVAASAMTQQIKNINVNGDHATAEVEFGAKNGDQNVKMSFAYSLQRTNGQWNVVKSDSLGAPHTSPAGQGPPSGQ